MDEHILVLNRSWLPIAITTVKRGMSLVFRGHARIVDNETFDVFTWDRWLGERSSPICGDEPHDPRYIHTVSLKIELPRVVTLSMYNDVPTRQLPFSRRTLFRRDNFQCQYCGVSPGVRLLTIDHVMPSSRGGDTSWMNCVVSCVRCNVRKGDRTPEEAGLKMLRPLFKPNWLDGFTSGRNVPVEWEKFLVKRTTG